MSKPLPNCHYCGKTVARKPRIIFNFRGEEFAWHTGTSNFACIKKDPTFKIACKGFLGEIPERQVILELYKTQKRLA
jgi:hypothetical protein